MEYRPFGRTGLQVSAIGFGCWEICGGYGRIEEMEFARAVGRALDLGINCFGWDNCGVMHRVIPYDADSGRMMHRTTLYGVERIKGVERAAEVERVH